MSAAKRLRGATRHRRPVALPVAALLAALAVMAGCGDRRLVLKVDVLSYMSPSQTQAAFGPVPAFPGGIASGEQPLVDDAQINMFQGLTDVTDIQRVSIAMSAVVMDSTGSGVDTLRVYASDPATSPMSTAPILMAPFALVAGVTDTVEVVLDGDQRINDLFAGKKMRLSVTTSLRGPSSGADLNGRIRIRALDAVVIAGRKPM